MKKIVYKREIPEIVEQTPDGEQVVIREAYLQTESLCFTEATKELQIAEALKYAHNGEYEIVEISDEPEPNFIPTPEQSAVVMMRVAFAQQVKDMESDMVLRCSGLAEPWVPGDHKSGEVYNVGDQTWECFADYDNSTYPDVKPGDPSWFTFNRPLHGKSIETARPWVKPENGTTDIFHSGEYMVFTDEHTYKAKRDTNYSPEEYPADWEKVD